ncbi:hypothetical protein Dalu01_03321 [Deinococcus aluminii]|uniref:Uncharacterized protein n=1 Tax=Deinococcus aluminii TaxID=1656885 RepID=A0ABP9XHR1_9DEIO
MRAEWTIRRFKGTRFQTSEIVRCVQKGTRRSSARQRQAALAATRNGWATFEVAPEINEFEPATERKPQVASITPPRRIGKPGGASILVPEGEWGVEEQLREERDRAL